MYKDKEQANEAAKERMRRYRQKGVTKQGVTVEGVTEGMTLDEQGIGYYPLKEGLKRWYPGNNGYHPQGCKCGIEHKRKPDDYYDYIPTLDGIPND